MHMMIVDISLTAIAERTVSNFLDLFTFDILPIEPIYDYFLGYTPESPTRALGIAKYDSESFIRNLGSVNVFYIITLYVMFQIWFIGKIVLPDYKDTDGKNNMLQDLYDGVEKRMHKKVLKENQGLVLATKRWNRITIFNLVWSAIISILLSACIQQRYGTFSG